MQGLAGSIKPNSSGAVEITISGMIDLNITTINDGVTHEICFGTGTAPVNAAALTGTVAGVAQELLPIPSSTAVVRLFPFSINAIITGLTPGTTYWIDLAAKAITTASKAQFQNVVINAIELAAGPQGPTGSTGPTGASGGPTGPTGPANAVPAFVFAVPANPTAPLSNGTRTMMGLAAHITPATNGRVHITIDGFFVFGSVTAGNGMAASVAYGTGTAPINGAALTGSQPGQIIIAKNSGAATAVGDISVPFSITVISTGLVVGTTYWIDLAVEGIGSGAVGTVQNIEISATEF